MNDRKMSFLEMSKMDFDRRLESELRVLEGLMAAAVSAQKFSEAAKIFEKAQKLFAQAERRRR